MLKNIDISHPKCKMVLAFIVYLHYTFVGFIFLPCIIYRTYHAAISSVFHSSRIYRSLVYGNLYRSVHPERKSYRTAFCTVPPGVPSVSRSFISYLRISVSGMCSLHGIIYGVSRRYSSVSPPPVIDVIYYIIPVFYYSSCRADDCGRSCELD
jgi:hypothetical protein